MPKLWNYVNLRVYVTHSYPNPKFINLRLERSRNEPLSVEISLFNYGMESPPELHKCLVRLLSHNISRWKTARLYLNYTILDLMSWAALLSEIRSAGAPLLEFIYVGVDVEAIGGYLKELLPSRLWMDAPALRTFEVNVRNTSDQNWAYPYFPSWAVRNQIPYGQITHLKLRAERRIDIITWGDIYIIFASAPNLVSCFLLAVEDTVIPYATEPIVLRHLEHLYLEASGNYWSGKLTHQLESILIAPALLTLSLANDNSWNQESYIQFITRSQCQLYELHLVDLKIPISNFLECMQLSPSLQIVHIHKMVNTEQQEVGRSMMEMEWDTATATEKFTLVPSLHIFSVGYSGVSASESMLEMLKKRICPPNGSLKTFTTLFIPSEDEIMADPVLQALCEEPWGLRVSRNDNVHTMWELYGGGY